VVEETNRVKKKFGATGFFALIVAALLAFTVYDYSTAQKKDEARENQAKVIHLKKEDITSIEVIGPKASFHLQKVNQMGDQKVNQMGDQKVNQMGDQKVNQMGDQKVDGHWRIAAPIDESADQQAVFAFLDSLVGEKSSQTVKQGDVDLKTYGLQSPLFTLTVQSAGEKEVLKLGSVRAYDGSLYGQIDDAKKVLLLSSSWDVLMSKPGKDFRDTKLYHGVMKADFDDIIVSGKLANFEIIRDQGTYQLKTPNKPQEPKNKSATSDPLLKSAVEAWLEQIKALRGAAFVESPKGVMTPDYKIVLKRKDADPYTLVIARDPAHATQFEATSTDLPGKTSSRVIVGAYAVKSIMFQVDAFYSKKAPFEFKLADVKTLKFHDAKTGKDQTSDVDAAHPDDLIAKLGALEAVRFLGPASRLWSEKKFSSHLSLLKSDGSLVFEMSWGEPVIESATPDRPESRYLPVKTNLSTQIIGIPEKQIAALGAQPEPNPKPQPQPQPKTQPQAKPEVR
jgi:hypothetical protein